MDIAFRACSGPRSFHGYWQGKKDWECKVPKRSSLPNMEATAHAG